ncbi:MAG: hypothetical protein ACRD2B_11825, partial [Terriglobia bacterium]
VICPMNPLLVDIVASYWTSTANYRRACPDWRTALLPPCTAMLPFPLTFISDRQPPLKFNQT